MKHLQMMSDALKHFYWTLVAQGVLFVALGVLIAWYPPILVVVASISFVLVGFVLFSLAWRIYTIWKRLPELIKK
jgi:O-antigen/teichoic acid export membrane protein